MLAMYGLDVQGELYLHVRVHKQAKVYGDVVFYGGKASIMCRECLRWHNIVIRDRSATLEETKKPAVVEERLEAGVSEQ